MMSEQEKDRQPCGEGLKEKGKGTCAVPLTLENV